MAFKEYLEFGTSALLLVIAFTTAYIAYQMYRANSLRVKHDIYEKRLAVYREVMGLLNVIASGADITREALLDYRAKTHEGTFLFEQRVADYLNEIYVRGIKLWNTNARLRGQKLPVVEERDHVAAENAAQLIWLADQLPMAKKRFTKYLNIKNMA